MSTRFPTRILQIAEEVADLGNRIENLLKGTDYTPVALVLTDVGYETFDGSDSPSRVRLRVNYHCAEVLLDDQGVVTHMILQGRHERKLFAFELDQTQIEDLRQGRLSRDELIAHGQEVPLGQGMFWKISKLPRLLGLNPLETEAVREATLWMFEIFKLQGTERVPALPFEVSSPGRHSSRVHLSFQGGLRAEVSAYYDMEEYIGYGDSARQPDVIVRSLRFQGLPGGLPDLVLDEDWCRSLSDDADTQEKLSLLLRTGTSDYSETMREMVRNGLRQALGLAQSAG